MDFQLSEETPFETRYFWAKADADGAVQQLDAGHIAAISEEQALEFARQALQKGKYTGYMGLYKYRVTRQDTETFLVFVDRSAQLEGALFFLLVSGVVGAAALLIMLVAILPALAAQRFRRWQGAAMLGCYAAYLGVLVFVL